MDLTGFIILAGGAWALSLPFVETYFLMKRKYLFAAIYAAPIAFFVSDYLLP